MSQLSLPESWSQGHLGDYFQTVSGNTPSKKKKEYYGRAIPFVKPPELRDGVIFEAEDNLSHEGAELARVLPPKSVLVSCIGNLGKIGLNLIPVAFNQQINAITPNERVIPEFLFYQVLSPYFLGQLNKLAGGTTVPIVNKTKFNSINIVLPPLPEQKRIVAILDKAFAGIDKAIANAEKNLANARELFESYLNNIFTQKGEGWEEAALGEVAHFKNGLNFSKNSNGESVRIVGVKDFRNNYYVPIGELGTVQVDGGVGPDYELHNNDIVTVRSNGNKELIGRCMLVDGITQKTSYSGFTIRIRIDSSAIKPKFLVHYLKTGAIRKILTKDGGGVNISNLNQKILSNIPIVIPSIAEQSQIVRSIDDYIRHTNKLTIVYQDKLSALTELKQSILQKAFSGELTPDSIN